MDSSKTPRRLILAGAFAVGGLMMLGVAQFAGTARDALSGREGETPLIPQAQPRDKPDSPPGVIHVEPGDPFPEATPLRPGARPAGDSKPSALPPSEASRDQLVQEIISLHARIAELEAEQARLKEELRRTAH